MNEPLTNPSEFVSPLARLFQIARKKGYITYDEILAIWPDPELAIEDLERFFGALIAADIPFGDENGFDH